MSFIKSLPIQRQDNDCMSDDCRKQHVELLMAYTAWDLVSDAYNKKRTIYNKRSFLQGWETACKSFRMQSNQCTTQIVLEGKTELFLGTDTGDAALHRACR